MNKEVIIDTNKFKKVHVTIQYVFRANFNDTYYLEELRPKTGEDQDVRDYVMNSDVSREFFKKLEDMVSFLIPHYIEEGKNHLVIAIGCTGGRHRSVTISNLIYDELIKKGYRVVKKHRDYTLR